MKIKLSKSELGKILQEYFKIDTIVDVEVEQDSISTRLSKDNILAILKRCKELLPKEKIQAIKEFREFTTIGDRRASLVECKAIIDRVDDVIRFVDEYGKFPEYVHSFDKKVEINIK